MYHKVILAGYLGQKPELRYTPSGVAVTNLSVATNRTWKDSNGEKVEEVTWFRVTCWNRLAEVAAQYLDKGRAVLIEGHMNPNEFGSPRIWQTSDGENRASYEMTARELRFLGGGNGNGRQADDDAFEDLSGGPEPADQEEIPF